MKHDGFVIGTDIHGDMQEKRIVNAFLTFTDEYKPRYRICAGDIWDFRAWRRGADEEERRHLVLQDFNMGMQFLERFRPTHITLGNHDIRLWDVAEGAGPTRDYAIELIERFQKLTRRFKTKVLPYDKRKGILRIGKMKVAHGYFDGTNAARQMAQAFGSVLFGHGHSIDVASAPSHDRRAARMIGCLCRLDFHYNRKHVASLRQAHGWAYGAILPSGDYHAFQAEVVGKSICVTDGVRVLKV